MDASNAERIWGALRAAIQEIYNKNASSLSYEELYRNAYNLVLHKHGHMLYNGVQQTVSAHLQEAAGEVISASDEALLESLANAWREHKVTMVMIRDILMYMDRTFVPSHKKLLVYDMGLDTFRSVVLFHKDVLPRAQREILAAIARERRGELVDRDLLRDLLAMFVELGINSRDVYENNFETQFLEETERFYRQEAAAYIASNTCPDYLRKVEERIAEEQDEDSGAQVMLRRKSLVEAIAQLRTAMQQQVVSLGMGTMEDPEVDKEPIKFMTSLLELRDHYDEVVTAAFRGDPDFERTLKISFEKFMNVDQRATRFLCTYADDLLRSKVKTMSESEVEDQLDKIISLFRFLHSKDVFEAHYREALAKRLLSGRTVSDDLERSFITKLKGECGYQFTAKLEGMFRDMHTSRSVHEEFKRSVGHTVGDVELSITVLTAGNWPSQQVPTCVLPDPAQRCCDAFARHYHQIHTGRKLSWQTGLGTADVRALLGGKRYELNVSTYQMCVLLLFNRYDAISFKDLCAEISVPVPQLKRHLVSLLVPRVKLLLKERKGKDLLESDVFRVNPDFKSRLTRVRIPLVSLKGGDEMKSTPESVQEDRRHLIEASIVRIMKTRKTLDHQSLMAEVTRQLSVRFHPSPQVVKQRIENLIEREYLERVPDDRRVYRYLA